MTGPGPTDDWQAARPDQDPGPLPPPEDTLDPQRWAGHWWVRQRVPGGVWERGYLDAEGELWLTGLARPVKHAEVEWGRVPCSAHRPTHTGGGQD